MRSMPDSFSFWGWMSSLSSDERTFLIFLCFLSIIIVILIISTVIYKTHKNRLEDSLKRELMERGLSVEEIERIVAAKGSARRKETT